MQTEKKCRVCGETKFVDDFHWKSKRRGTRQPRCKVCASEYGHSHYVENSQEYKDRANTRLKTLRANNHDLVKAHLSSNQCSKCGESNARVLSVNVDSYDISNLSTVDLSARLTESTVLCRNCEVAVD